MLVNVPLEPANMPTVSTARSLLPLYTATPLRQPLDLGSGLYSALKVLG